MVNTRRTESIGASPEINTQHRTRRSVAAVDENHSSIVNSSEESQADDASSWQSDSKPKPSLTIKKDPTNSKVRELRSRFVCSERQFSARLRSEEINTRKRIDRHSHSLAVYSRNMHDDSDMYNGNDSVDEVYSRSRRPRHSNSHMARIEARIERRTALSLRPISQKCYADSISPLHFNSDYEGGVRRSKRQRKVQSQSWLADDQMHKMGYPTLNAPGYSEDDSRDAPEPLRRTTRHSGDVNSNKRREVKNPKYLYDYETTDVSPRRRRPSETVLIERSKRESRNLRESNDKENEEGTSINGRSHTKTKPTSKDDEEDDDNEEDDDGSKNKDEEDSNTSSEVKENGMDGNENESAEGPPTLQPEVIQKADSSESDEVAPRMRTRLRSNNNLLIKQNYDRNRRKRTGSESSSSESEERGKKYSLRNRVPKPAPKSLLRLELPSRRRRFTRRRKVSSSSNSSSDSDDRRIPVKTPKNLHSKNEQKMKSGAGGSKIIPIGPETLDTKVRFSSIGGLDSHIQCLKEMILLPMMYPEVFKQFQIQPPRGVLFHGPPGTGKTLIARALANECSIGCRKVSFFMRKGADLLSKWIGESEKQLRLLFEQASEMAPSIIFFDELDGLAPVRSSRQDQVHASIVSTLLALMDGLDNRGEVIVIGATNRIDAIDPALRRPGRFDRELFFPLPDKKDREEILKVHVSPWSMPPSQQLLMYLAETAVGYCGSDLRALCSEAVIQSFRRTYPQVYSADYRLLLDPKNVKVQKIDFLRAKSSLVPASHRVTQGLGRKLLPILEPLLGDALNNSMKMLTNTFPHGLNPTLSKVKLSPNIKAAHLLLVGESPDCGQTTHLAPAILYRMEHIHTYLLDLATLFRETGRSPEETCIQVFNEARRNVPSVIYIPNIDSWWSLVTETVKAILESQLSHLDPNTPILFLGTADSAYDNLANEIQNIFSRYRKEVYQLELPNENIRRAFFKPLLIDLSLSPPHPQRKRLKTPSPLPRAPTPLPSPLTEDQAKKLYEQEEHTLRELRIFLRDMCKKLANNKLFFMFTKPVDTEEVPDYPTIIKQPMDLETMMTKVDFHRYECAKDFLNDIELICHNALEYNPAKTSADKQIRHRACSLRDYAYTLIKNEMDTDFEEKCQDIAVKRHKRKGNIQKYLPAYIQTKDDKSAQKLIVDEPQSNPPVLTPADQEQPSTTKNDDKDKAVTEKVQSNGSSNKSLSTRKRKHSSWQRGYLSSRKKRKLLSKVIVTIEDKEKASSPSDDSKDTAATISPSCALLVNGLVDMDDSQLSNVTNMEATTPLSINCNDIGLKSGPNSSQSPRRRLSDLMSPSELLENPLEFDDIDQALNETVCGSSNPQPIECSRDELDTVLAETVKITMGCSLQSLLDLYNQLRRIIKKYAYTHRRMNLPKDLTKEVTRFKNEENEEGVSEDSPASDQIVIPV